MASKQIILDAQGQDLVKILPGNWRNFSGKKGQYNAEGQRNFTIGIYDDSMIKELTDAGLKVKEWESSNATEDTEPLHFLRIKCMFNDYGPKVYLYTKGDPNATELDEETISMLDEANIVDCVVKIRLYEWEVNGNSGVTPYLSELAVQISPNRFGARFEEPVDTSDLPF